MDKSTFENPKVVISGPMHGSLRHERRRNPDGAFSLPHAVVFVVRVPPVEKAEVALDAVRHGGKVEPRQTAETVGAARQPAGKTPESTDALLRPVLFDRGAIHDITSID